MTPTSDDDNRTRRQNAERLAIYEVLVIAMERRNEVFNAIESSYDMAQAAVVLADLLHVTDLQARLVLDLQLHRCTIASRERIHAERNALRDALARPQ